MVDMRDHVKDMIDENLTEIKCNAVPQNGQLLKVDEDIPLLSPDEAGLFHLFVMKGMFLAKRACPDKEPGIGFLRSRFKSPAQQDKLKLIKKLGCLK